MGVYLSDCLEQLDPAELKRVQLSLKAILRNHNGSADLRSCLSTGFRRLGRPRSVLTALGPESEEAFDRLLEAFGLLPAEALSDSEARALADNPYTVRLPDGACMVPTEARQHLAQEPHFRTARYLFAHVYNLPVREARAWARWLDLEARSDRKRKDALYTELAALSGEADDAPPTPQTQDEPLYLRDLFPDEPGVWPVAWYYRGVLTLYGALAQTETQDRPLNEQQEQVVHALKSGRMLVAEERPEFGAATRYRLHRVREQTCGRPEGLLTGLPAFSPDSKPADTKESFLF